MNDWITRVREPHSVFKQFGTIVLVLLIAVFWHSVRCSARRWRSKKRKEGKGRLCKEEAILNRVG